VSTRAPWLHGEAAAARPHDSAAAERSRAFVRELFGDALGKRIGLRLWDGTSEGTHGVPGVLVVTAPHALRAAFSPPVDPHLGEAFAAGLLDVDGDLVAVIDSIMDATAGLDAAARLRLGGRLLALPATPVRNLLHVPRALRIGDPERHSPERDAAAVRFHYDRPVDFYRTFLDSGLVYSCAYWDGARTLDEAQHAKLDYVLDKLDVRPGERFLDVGCGWGALVLRAALRGAYATGLTLSRHQYAEALARIARSDPAGSADVELRDYRDLKGRQFDKIASVGMVEHVGRNRLTEYFRAIYDALRPGGLFLNHGIADESEGRKGWKATGFIGRYVFPGGELVPLSDLLSSAERSGFEVRDVENLREHYARTLRAWRENLERNREAVVGASDAFTYRAWRAYLAGSEQGFLRGRMAVFQVLLARPDARGSVAVAPTRGHLYR